MPNVHANGIDIEYETFGDSTSDPLLLIMGYGRQMIAWPDTFCAALADRGFHVIRYDNRDVGLTTMTHAPYTIDDMADDAAGLLSALGFTAAHVVGASMGGAIAQSLAIRRPEMVLSLTSIMSGPGRLDQTPSDPEVMRLIATDPPVADRAGAIERAVRIARAVGSPGMFDEARTRDAAARAWDRNPAYDGLERQGRAIAAAGDRTDALHSVRVPALVIHGEADPLVSVDAGRRTAEAIPGARLLTVSGMGHDLPTPVWPLVIDAIADVAARASTAPVTHP
jgi:pimeloyl-ACP methyl ester carboxylesterase